MCLVVLSQTKRSHTFVAGKEGRKELNWAGVLSRRDTDALHNILLAANALFWALLRENIVCHHPPKTHVRDAKHI